MVTAIKMQELLKNALKIEYEPEVDVLTVYFKDPETQLSYSDETSPAII
jgi:hypothetical protein